MAFWLFKSEPGAWSWEDQKAKGESGQEWDGVVRRGANTTMPRVAVLVNPDGIATGEHAIRDTSTRECRIVGGVAPGECKVKIQLDRMLALTGGPTASGRTW